MEIITVSGAPQSGRHYLFLNPPAGAAITASQILAQAIKKNLATICFTQSRKLTELIHVWSMRQAPELRRYISSYRAGFLPEERREIEARLATGKMRGVISTSALELGIDIGGLDVCLLVGYPGTMVTALQRIGRVGRQGRDCLIVLVAQPYALDQYFMKNPEQGRLPDLNLGTAGGASCAPRLRAALLQVLAAQGRYTQVTDGRFKGGSITRRYGQPASGVHAVQLEMCWSTYMDEQPPYEVDARRAALLEPGLRALLQAVLAWRPDA